MSRIRLGAYIALCAFFLGWDGTGSGHHSPIMFDNASRVTLTGTVRTFEWTNPHCYIQLVVKDARGRDVEWSVEMGAPLYLYNRGWRPSTLRAGDEITVVVAPLRNGGNGGLIQEATRSDGKPLGSLQ